ncbi:MAG: Nif3-like dinuclear metal center hexameric protein [Methanoregulaceae archaeon]
MRLPARSFNVTPGQYLSMDVRAFIDDLERIAPPDLAEDYDAERIGLIVEGKREISQVCCSLDATPKAVQEAVRLNADMLVVHHTPFWDPLTRITGLKAQLLKSLLSSDMNLYVMHTNFDRAPQGVNGALAGILDLTDITGMSMGLVGSCSISIDEISRKLGGNIRIWGKGNSVNRLAIVGGSGFDTALIDEAVALGAEAFLSSELKHHVARSSPLLCIEATHYALEAPAMRMLAFRKGWHFIDDVPVIHVYP